MSKSELIQKIVENLEANGVTMTKSNTSAVVDAFLAEVQSAVASGDEVSFVGFGKFYVRETKARKGRNPQTGAEIDIPAKKSPAFSAGKKFKDAVNG